MNTTPPSDDAPAVLRLDGDLTIYRAAELKPVLLAALEQTRQLEIDLAGVSEIDCAGVQILIMAKQHALASGRELRLAGHSEPVITVLEELNLAAFFGDPLVIPQAATS